MYIFRSVILILFVLRTSSTTLREEKILLQNAVDGLFGALQYMENHVKTINLDGAFGVLLAEEILRSFLEFNADASDYLGSDFSTQLETLSVKASDIVQKVNPYLKRNDPQYYKSVGNMVHPHEALVYHPRRTISRSLIVEPLPCSESVFNETLSDACMKEIVGTPDGKVHRCNISKACINQMSSSRQRDYWLTHQILFFQMAEMGQCIGRSQLMNVPEKQQVELCSNVMRDAERIAKANFPVSHRDLLMEQIGLCGMWGFQDFYKPEWLERILEWQSSSGCYKNRVPWKCTENLGEDRAHTRIKRAEKILRDGCLSHKTAVAIVALASMIRLSSEQIIQTLKNDRSQMVAYQSYS